ncbi:MAG: conjugal transfer protein TraH [Trichlorobacter sp.]|nr:conjugal transfer protein TraH [Trichlorobacter sp.]
MLFSTSAHADWAQDWFDNKTSTSGGYYAGQQRGYLYGGSYSARWATNQTGPLLSFNPPKARAGCGGIDFYMGSLSFLQPDQLVEKFQTILQNSAGLAFDMALQTLCPTCSQIMKDLEALSDTLNALAMDDCKLATAAVNFTADKVFGASMNAAKESVTEDGILGSFNSATKKMRESLDGINTTVNDWAAGQLGKGTNTVMDKTKCSAALKKIFPDSKTAYPKHMTKDLLQTDMGLPAAHAEIMRAIFGEIKVYQTAQGITNVTFIPPCSEYDFSETTNLINTQNGWVMGLTGNNTCTQTANPPFKPLQTYSEQVLDKLINGMKNRTGLALVTKDSVFINSMPYALHYAIRMAVASGNEMTMRDSLAQLTTAVMVVESIKALAARTDGISRTLAVIKANASTEGCQIGKEGEDMEKALEQFRASVNSKAKYFAASTDAAFASFMKSVDYASSLYDIEERLTALTAKAFGPGAANKIKDRMKQAKD